MTTEQKSLVYQIGSDLIKYAIVIVVTVMIMRDCKGCEPATIPNNQLAKDTIQQLDKQDKATEIKQALVVKKIDSIALLTNQLNIAKAKLYKAGRITIINNICNTDSVLKQYDSLYNSCEVESNSYKQAINAWRYLDSLKQNRLDIRGSEIVQYKSIVKSDSLVIDSLVNVALPKEFKRGKKIGRKQGFVVGVVVTEAVNVGAKVVPMLK